MNTENTDINNVLANNLKRFAFIGIFLGLIFLCLILIYFENDGIIPGITILCFCVLNSLYIYILGEIIDLIQKNVNNTDLIIKKSEIER